MSVWGLFSLISYSKPLILLLQIKGGGHTMNPGFSSTNGVQIGMSEFSDIVYDPEAQTVTVGAGVIWDDVYSALEPHGMNVIGGRVSGIGVAGFALGGGTCTVLQPTDRFNYLIHPSRIFVVDQSTWFDDRYR